MIALNQFDDDEHYCYEMEMYRISNQLALLIEKHVFNAYSFSDDNQIATNNFDGTKSMLPLKTLAVHAALGWIKGIYPVRETAEKAIKEDSLFVLKKEGVIAGSIILNHTPETAYKKKQTGVLMQMTRKF